MGIEDRAVRVKFIDKRDYKKAAAESMLLVCDEVPGGGMPLYAGLGNNIDGPVAQKGVTEAIADLADAKVDKELGKGLSTNDYTTVEKQKLAGYDAQEWTFTLADGTTKTLNVVVEE